MKKLSVAVVTGMFLVQLSSAAVIITIDENPGGGVRFSGTGVLDVAGAIFAGDLIGVYPMLGPAGGGSLDSTRLDVIPPGGGSFDLFVNSGSIEVSNFTFPFVLFDSVSGLSGPFLVDGNDILLPGNDDDAQDSNIYNINFVAVDIDGDINDYSGFSWVWTLNGNDPDPANHGDTVSFIVVPEPSTSVLGAVGLMGLALLRKRK